MKLLSIFVGILSLAEAQKSKARSNDEKIRVQAARNRDKINAKKDKLEKIFDSQAAWFKENFGPGSMTTDEYTPHARRIYRNWLSKYERNKDRMIARLEKCGLQSISHSRKNKGRNRRQATEEEIIEGKLKGFPKYTREEVQEFLKKNGVTPNVRPLGPQVRGRGRKKSSFESSFRSAQNKFADNTDDFVEWANHYISQCRPHQPDLQMSRFAQWYVVLNQKLISKNNHLDASQRGGFDIYKLDEE
ncbi:Oidioi.mRNA.OKI2018_I69.chr1.g2114.t1.cds [Oikopleura dioica]|uniref:Oidioi.mRNA.OKI2018_I69.chr1.g2114.t1.cds n=1 Tax=Oikopleura dioica TaxID=34765 RepID=A0ABN7SQ37_OIKDI|nr:Oidioi.mRNA.OKI2018_I69.chr1.g2114.t1.cds [Oikopleura dioica]